ncbi:hypothetical protein F190043G2_31500 [Blautia caecimuris]|jgi:hypothetical protein
MSKTDLKVFKVHTTDYRIIDENSQEIYPLSGRYTTLQHWIDKISEIGKRG